MINLPIWADIIFVGMMVIVFADVVICKIQRRHRRKDFIELKTEIEKVHQVLDARMDILERHYSDTKVSLLESEVLLKENAKYYDMIKKIVKV